MADLHSPPPSSPPSSPTSQALLTLISSSSLPDSHVPSCKEEQRYAPSSFSSPPHANQIVTTGGIVLDEVSKASASISILPKNLLKHEPEYVHQVLSESLPSSPKGEQIRQSSIERLRDEINKFKLAGALGETIVKARNRDKGGGFSIKAVWDILRLHSARVEWANLLWFKYHIPRHSFILWLAIRGRLSTQDRLCSFGLAQHMCCYLCGENVEDHNHLFFNCSYSFRIWRILMMKCTYLVDSFSPWERVQPWAISKFKGKSLLSFVGRISFAAAVYHIWMERNSRKHGNHPKTEQTLITMIRNQVKMRLMNGSGFPSTPTNLHLIQEWNLQPSLIGRS